MHYYICSITVIVISLKLNILKSAVCFLNLSILLEFLLYFLLIMGDVRNIKIPVRVLKEDPDPVRRRKILNPVGEDFCTEYSNVVDK